MIGFLRGQLVSKQPPLLLLDVNGVGYEVEAPMSTFYQLAQQASPDQEVVILTHMHVREDAMLLYGFATEEERQLFRLLLKVNGVGAKMALAILSSMSVVEFCGYVMQDDIVSLTRIPGVGKKTAERLLIEMRDKLKDDTLLQQAADTIPSENPVVEMDTRQQQNQIAESALAALISLGYTAKQAESLLNGIDIEGLTLEVVIKQALQQVKLT
ncbi:Holliday junction branch migration protein RuvA [Galenea microaerophila]